MNRRFRPEFGPHERRPVHAASERVPGGPLSFRDLAIARRMTARREHEIEREIAHQLRVAQHAATLSRLAARIHCLLDQARVQGQHLRAAMTAYDEVLVIAATDLGLEPVGVAPLQPVDRLELEVELSLAGLRWSTHGS